MKGLGLHTDSYCHGNNCVTVCSLYTRGWGGGGGTVVSKVFFKFHVQRLSSAHKTFFSPFLTRTETQRVMSDLAASPLHTPPSPPPHICHPTSLSLSIFLSEECDWHWRRISNCHGVNAFKNMRSGCGRWALPFSFAIIKNTHTHTEL